MASTLKKYALSLVLFFISLGLGVWTWLAFRNLQAILLRLEP